MALAVGLHAATTSAVTGMAEASVSALAKVVQVMLALGSVGAELRVLAPAEPAEHLAGRSSRFARAVADA